MGRIETAADRVSPGFSIRRMNAEHVPEVVTLCCECLSPAKQDDSCRGRLLTSFLSFAKRVEWIGLVAVDLANGHVVGYICGTVATDRVGQGEIARRATRMIVARQLFGRTVARRAASRRPVDDIGTIKSIAVDPNLRHRGLGRQLVGAFRAEVGQRIGAACRIEMDCQVPVGANGVADLLSDDDPARVASDLGVAHRANAMASRARGTDRGSTTPPGSTGLEVGHPEILLITISFGGEQHVRRLLQDPAVAAGDGRLAVIVVDNDPHSDRLSPLQPSCDDAQAELMCSGKNLGYFGAAWWALERYLTKHELPEWVVVCNPDIKFEEENFFARFLELYGRSDATLVAPAIVSAATGEVDPIYMVHRPTGLRMHFLKWVFHWYAIAVLYHFLSVAKQRIRGRRPRSLEPPPTSARTIYAPHGSFFIFSRRYFERGGTLEHPAFLFGEEVFVGEAVRRMRGTALYDPRLRLVHEGRGSTDYVKNRVVARFAADATSRMANEFWPPRGQIRRIIQP